MMQLSNLYIFVVHVIQFGRVQKVNKLKKRINK